MAAISPDKLARLNAFLAELPLGAAAKLFAGVERDKLAEGALLPHDDMLAALRGRLREGGGVFPERLPTPQRIFFTPIEDLLVAGRPERKRAARIARTSLAPLWRVLTTDFACVEMPPAQKALARAVLSGDIAARMEAERAMFAAASEGFSRIWVHCDEDPGYRRDLVRRLGGEVALADAREISFILPAAEEILSLQDRYRRPLGALTSEDLYDIRGRWAGLREALPEQAAYLFLILSARMAQPWKALKLYANIKAVGADGVPGAEEDAAVIPQRLFEDIEHMARALSRDAELDLDLGGGPARIAAFSEFADGVETEAREIGDQVLINRIAACRDVGADAFERFLEQSIAAVRAVTPTRHAGGASRVSGLRPDASRAPDRATLAVARDAAGYLLRAERTAGRLGRSDAAAALRNEATAALRVYAQDLVGEIRAAEGAERAKAKRLMSQVLELCDILLPVNETDLLRRRAAAAAIAA